MSIKKRLAIRITGIVQGVGFRPHVYNLAHSLDLDGFILNDSGGVFIEIEGNEESLEQFCLRLQSSPPPLSRISSFQADKIPPTCDHSGFIIRESLATGARQVAISPDVATCSDCLREMTDPGDPRHNYPFINCTNCGPRFTIITDVPYDRKNSTMAGFSLCPLCRSEYEDPSNRRFHAQPVACPRCGPHILLLDNLGNKIELDPRQVMPSAARLLEEGHIIAIKGIGGYHLAVDASSDQAVLSLRKKKIRYDKPFALMAGDIEQIRRHCRVNESEARLLLSTEAPIVLLEKLGMTGLSENIAPGCRHLGIMLPYTPLHHILFKYFSGLLVMTSGNLSDEPIAFQDEDAFSRLGQIADFFLTHNRPIHLRCDDTVTRVFRGAEYPLRRSRGYVPAPVSLPISAKQDILAVGGHQKNSFCLVKEGRVFLSHHIGDLENPSAITSFQEGIEHFSRLFDITPTIIAHDLHPDYASTIYARSIEGVKLIPVQHHHAHVCSVLAEKGITGPAIGITIDGAGFGDDGRSWGFEIMLADATSYRRILHLDYIPLPGGGVAVREPWRMAVSYLYHLMGRNFLNLSLPLFKNIPDDKLLFLLDMIERNISCPVVSSGGRLFDAVSSLLGIRHHCNYEGQAAIEMEMQTDADVKSTYDFTFDLDKFPSTIDVLPIFFGIIEDLQKKFPHPAIAGKFHATIAEIITQGAVIAREQTGVKVVTLSGGVFQNMILLEMALSLLLKKGFEVLIHNIVPTNDGGLSLGQALTAVARLNQK